MATVMTMALVLTTGSIIAPKKANAATSGPETISAAKASVKEDGSALRFLVTATLPKTYTGDLGMKLKVGEGTEKTVSLKTGASKLYSYKEDGENVTVGYSVAITGIPGTAASTAIKAVGFAGEGEEISKATEVTRTVKQVANYAGYSFDEKTGEMAESDCILEGDILGKSASFSYVSNGFPVYSSMGIFAIDKSKLTAGSTIVLTYTAMEGERDVTDTQGFNIALKTGDKWDSPAVLDVFGKMGGSISIPITAEHLAKIGAEDTVYMHVATASAGFVGTFTYTSIKVGDESLVATLPDSKTYVENGVAKWAETARVNLPSDFDFNKYKKCKIEYTSTDPTDFNNFQALVVHSNGSDPQYWVNGTDGKSFIVTLDNVLKQQGVNPYVKIQTGDAGFSGSITINRITFTRE